MLPAGAWAAGSDLEHCADAPGVLGISALLAKPRSGTCQPHPGLQLRPKCFPRVTPNQTHILGRPGGLPHTCMSEAMGPQGSLSNMSQLTNRVPGNETHRSPQALPEAHADCGSAGHSWCPSQGGCRASVCPHPRPEDLDPVMEVEDPRRVRVQPPAQPRARRGAGGHLRGLPRGW